MRLSEVNKEIEKNKKETKMIGIFLAVVFLVAELCFLGIGYKFKEYDGLGAMTFIMLVIMGIGIPKIYKESQKEHKTLIEKRTKLEQDEQFIKRRVGIYEAADDEQKKQLHRAYFDVNTAYKANFLGSMDLVSFALSCKDFCRWAGVSKNTYETAVKELIERSYLVRKEEGSNVYIFYEMPQNDEVIMIENPAGSVSEKQAFCF